jgi:hypothetical protein
MGNRTPVADLMVGVPEIATDISLSGSPLF